MEICVSVSVFSRICVIGRGLLLHSELPVSISPESVKHGVRFSVIVIQVFVNQQQSPFGIGIHSVNSVYQLVQLMLQSPFTAMF